MLRFHLFRRTRRALVTLVSAVCMYFGYTIPYYIYIYIAMLYNVNDSIHSARVLLVAAIAMQTVVRVAYVC